MEDTKDYAASLAVSFGLDDPARTVALFEQDEAKRPWLRKPPGFWPEVKAELERLAAEPRKTTHYFESTGEAYDACQCDARIKTGDMLIIANEGVIGMAWAWPVAITAEHGALHGAKDPGVITSADGMGATAEQLADALCEAHRRFLPIDPVFRN